MPNARSSQRWGEPEGSPDPDDARDRPETGLAHDLNNLLTTMVGWAELARRRDLDPARREAALEILERSARRAREMACLCLEDETAATGDTRRIGVATLLEEALGLHGLEIDRAKIEVFVESEPHLAVEGDPVRLFRALDNLLRNALEVMPDGGRLRVTCAPLEGERLRIAVEDSGPGVDPTVAQRLFDRRFTTKIRAPGTGGSGSGLGLWVSRTIAREHGGDLLYSPAPGGGARFELDLPRTTCETPGPAAPTTAGNPSLPPGISVLVIDDEEDIREMIRVALTLRGARVLAVGDGEEALAACRDGRFDLALVDFSMRGLSGHELGMALARQTPNLPLVYMSGSRIDTRTIPSVADFLKKPFDIDEVQRKVREVIERRPRG